MPKVLLTRLSLKGTVQEVAVGPREKQRDTACAFRDGAGAATAHLELGL